MKKTIIASIFGSLCFSAHADYDPLSTIHKNSPYYSGERATKISPYNGALISDAMYESTMLSAEELGNYTPNIVTHHNVADGVHTFNVGGILNVQVIETDNGVVLYDTAKDLKEGKIVYDALREVTDKPVVAIMYSHEHYVGGTQVIFDEEAKRGNTDIMVIGHHGHNESLAATVAGVALHKEASDIFLARAGHQFYNFVEGEGIRGCGHVHRMDVLTERGPVDVDTPITVDGQKMTIDGTEFVFYIEGITSDTEQQLMVHIPDRGVVMNNLIWGFFPNIYSLRGGAYRNPQGWIEGLEKMEALEATVLLNSHAQSVAGKDEVQHTIEVYQDSLTTVLNQTLMGMLTGGIPTEIAYDVSVPNAIADEPILRQDYGEIVTMVPQIYSAVMGSYNGIAADAVPMHPVAEADMIVRGMGGQEATLEFAKGELESGNFHYAVKLGNHLVNFDDQNQDHIDFAIESLYAMAEATESHNLRSWYLTRARIFKGEIALPNLMPVMPEFLERDVANYVDSYRIRLNHERAGDTRARIGFEFESGAQISLEIRNGVSYSRDTLANADVVIKMADVEFIKLYNNMETINMMVDAGGATITSGDLETAQQLLGLYDPVYDWQNDEGLKYLMSRLNQH
jgi:alkyl sulfatase BDS1-like metallo-beta-lactamase superfamily hydrolase